MLRSPRHSDSPAVCARSALTSPAWLLIALGSIGQLRHAAGERPEISVADARLEAMTADGDSDSTLADLTSLASAPGPAAEASTSSDSTGCASFFGPLTEKTTVIDMDHDGGCKIGVDSSRGMVHFAGGTDATCLPPAKSGGGCHRFIISRYLDDCDLSPLEALVGQEIALKNPEESSSLSMKNAFSQDGVYSQCDQAGYLQTRTMVYIGLSKDGGATCNQDLCKGTTLDDDDSLASRSSLFWAGFVLVAALVVQTL